MSKRRPLPLIANGQGSLGTDGRRNKIIPADVTGRFMRWRSVVFVVLMAVYLLLPWISFHGRPLVLFHLAKRQAFLFGLSFNAQDGWMMVFAFTGAAFALVVLTALLGRVWCGWGCPQTVWVEGLFRRLERWILGSREQRLRHSPPPWRTALLHAVYIAIALLLAHAWLAYFIPVREVLEYTQGSPFQRPMTFAFTMVFAGVLYFDFAWFREQFCVVLCPYGRMQSALIDNDSMIIGYDLGRGEPRGKKRKDPQANVGVGDCVDCNRCVVVCPTGIDIREGLQMDCIGCAACIDACDDIMDRLGRPRGLVRYDSQAGLSGQERKIWRPRLWLYTGLGVIGLMAMTLMFRTQHHAFEANVLRAAGMPYSLEGETLQNGLRVHLVNKLPDRTTFHFEAAPHDSLTFILPMSHVTLDSLADVDVPFFVRIPRAEFQRGMRTSLRVQAEGREETRELSIELLGPR